VTAVLLVLDTGGVRLHEANAGLVAISEILHAAFRVREAGIPILVLIGVVMVATAAWVFLPLL